MSSSINKNTVLKNKRPLFVNDPKLNDSAPNIEIKDWIDNYSKGNAKSFVESTIHRATGSGSSQSLQLRSAKTARKKLQSSNDWFSAAREELANITTLNLITSSGSILEKILWALIAIGGTIFIYNVVDIL